MREVRFVYFDLDDTLLDHRRAQDLALGDLHLQFSSLGTFPLDRVRAEYARVNGRVWTEYAAGTRDKEGTRSGRFSLLFESLGIEEDAMRAASVYLEAYADHWVLADGALDALKQIAGARPTGLLTNGFAEAQRAKLARFPEMAALFSTVVISEEEGVLKPHPELFRIASERAGADPEEILYVGDSLTSDVEGGLAAGWQVIWYAEAGESERPNVPRFRNWAELPSLIDVGASR